MNESDFKLAQKLYENGEHNKAFSLYQKLANEGSIDSQVYLGWMHENGIGTERNTKAAYSYFKGAAELGSPEAQFFLAKHYAGKDEIEKSRYWYLRSADYDYSPALYRLGLLAELGKGVAKDKRVALSFHSRAAKTGHVFAKK